MSTNGYAGSGARQVGRAAVHRQLVVPEVLQVLRRELDLAGRRGEARRPSSAAGEAGVPHPLGVRLELLAGEARGLEQPAVERASRPPRGRTRRCPGGAARSCQKSYSSCTSGQADDLAGQASRPGAWRARAARCARGRRPPAARSRPAAAVSVMNRSRTTSRSSASRRLARPASEFGLVSSRVGAGDDHRPQRIRVVRRGWRRRPSSCDTPGASRTAPGSGRRRAGRGASAGARRTG